MGAVRIAVVDMGSNTLKFSITEVDEVGGEQVLVADAQTVRLGAGIGSSGVIAPERASRALEVMRFYDAIARSHHVDAQLCVATAALRMASNGSDLITRIESETNWRVRIITGPDEARLAFAGLAAELPESGPALLLDIGGASTEAIHVVDRTMQASESNGIGSGTLADASLTADPPRPGEVAAAVDRACSVLESSPVITAAKSGTLVLSGGNGVFLSGLASWPVVDIPFTPGRFPDLLDRIATIPAADMAEHLEIAEERARMLPAGGAIALAAIQLSQPHTLLAVPSGIRGGVIADWLANRRISQSS